MIKRVFFDNFDSWNDFSLIRSVKTITSPEPKFVKVEIDGADGELDLTEYFGDVKYKNRKITFEFRTAVRESQFMTLFSEIQNSLHGRKMKIVLEEDPDFYYVGRVSVNEWGSDKNIGKITVECDCEPYKYKTLKTVFTLNLNSKVQYILPNLRKRVVPTFTISSPVLIEFNNSSFSIGASGMTGEQTFVIPEISLGEGDNLISLTGTGRVKIEYQEGSL
jgi:predicted phage tail component-like protein